MRIQYIKQKSTFVLALLQTRARFALNWILNTVQDQIVSQLARGDTAQRIIANRARSLCHRRRFQKNGKLYHYQRHAKTHRYIKKRKASMRDIQMLAPRK